LDWHQKSTNGILIHEKGLSPFDLNNQTKSMNQGGYTMKSVIIYCDGGCQGNPGPGTWAAILRYGDREKTISGRVDLHTTNNRMELTAAIEALAMLKEPCHVLVISDSRYLVRGATEWVARWVKNGWRNSQNKEVENRDLWIKLVNLSKQHRIEWQWVRGHAGHPENERCDKIVKSLLASDQTGTF
jgi:ribonuclease HI